MDTDELMQLALVADRSTCLNIVIDPAAIWPIPTAGRASSLMGY